MTNDVRHGLGHRQRDGVLVKAATSDHPSQRSESKYVAEEHDHYWVVEKHPGEMPLN